MNYKAVIGLEVHVELKTKSKMFCGCLADYFGQKPNTHTCPVCLGLPGALPVPNKKAIDWCIMIGLALNCEIPLFSKFDRKNYFYPDLPKGYQISQYDQPFCRDGLIHLAGVASQHLRGDHQGSSEVNMQNAKSIRIRRVHMEEDTAKLVHELKNQNGEGYSLIDFNRSGVPLVEIVTEPDFENAKEVVEYLKKLQQIVRYLCVSDADMEKGEMRLEPNISLRPCHPELVSGSNEMPKLVRHDNEKLPNYKVEVKNINSFRFVEQAINYEIKRQMEILDSGKIPTQETRGWDDKKQITVSQRIKEEANDYRYFPEPDIPPIQWEKLQIANYKLQMAELPDAKFERFKKEYGLSDYNAEILTREKATADYFEEAVKASRELSTFNFQLSTKSIANWIINKKNDTEQTLPAQLIQKIILSSQTTVIDKTELEDIVNKIIQNNPQAVKDYKKGRKNAIMFLIGQTTKILKEKIDIEIVKNVIINKLK